MIATARARRDLAITLIVALGLLAWDASAADLVLTRWVGDATGFAWRDAWLTRDLLHDGGRWLAAVALAVGLWQIWGRPVGGPARRARAGWTGVIVFSLLAVPALKRASLTSCPWDQAEFGGAAHYVSHWQWGLADGGPGHCFPSGHAVAAFAFFGLYFLWREHRPARARAWLWATLGAGVAFGLAQWLRGAHYPSHTLWTGWICWTIATLAGVAAQAWPRLRPAAPATPATVRAAAPRHAPGAARRGRRGARRRSADRSASRRR